MRIAFDRSSARRVDEDGHLHVADCPITKATVNGYYGKEIPDYDRLGLEPDRIYMMLRPPEELEKAAPLWGNKPLLDEHVEVRSEKPEKKHQAGVVGHGCYFDGEYVRTPQLTIWDQKDIDAVEAEEKHELSASYGYEPVMEPGVFKGLRYDGRMVNLAPNHVALVDRGRAGRDVKVNDALPKGLRMKKNAFDRFVRKARGLFANDADISTEELVDLLGAGSAIEEEENKDVDEGADDDELNPDPNAMDGIPEEIRGKLTDDEWGAVASHFKPKAEAEDEDPEDKPGEGEDDKDKPAKANDRKPAKAMDADAIRKPAKAMDADAIRKAVVAEIGAWQRACDKVAPHIGRVRVAMDALPGGASALYRKALDVHGVSHRGVKETAALEAMVDMLPGAPSGRSFASDSAPAGAKSPLDGVLPVASRISRSN